jgi:leader peptidase (prepilin peptidase)/N-methyltransferase
LIPLVAAALAAAAAAIYWMIADNAACKRRICLGKLPVMLLISVAVVAALACATGAHVSAIAALSGVAVAGWVDARTGSIFDPITLTLLATSFTLCVLQGAPLDGVIGAAGVGATLFSLHAITHGRGLGLGDVKLGAALGMALGATTALTALAVSFGLGALYGTALIALKRANRRTSIRFGPFMAVGTIAAILAPLAVPQ